MKAGSGSSYMAVVIPLRFDFAMKFMKSWGY